MQLFFIGLLGEYIASINTRVMKRPLVVEKERINFDIQEDEKKVVCVMPAKADIQFFPEIG